MHVEARRGEARQGTAGGEIAVTAVREQMKDGKHQERLKKRGTSSPSSSLTRSLSALCVPQGRWHAGTDRWRGGTAVLAQTLKEYFTTFMWKKGLFHYNTTDLVASNTWCQVAAAAVVCLDLTVEDLCSSQPA